MSALWEIIVPGTYVTAYITQNEEKVWSYGLYAGPFDEDFIAQGELDLRSTPERGDGPVATPEQVARIAYLLEVEYGDATLPLP